MPLPKLRMEGMEAAFSVTDLLMLTLLGTSFLELGEQRRQYGDQKATWRTENQRKEAVVLTDAIRKPVSHLLSDQQGPPFTHVFMNSTGICGSRTVQAQARYRGHSSRRVKGNGGGGVELCERH